MRVLLFILLIACSDESLDNEAEPKVAIPEARREGAKFFCSINMPEVVTRTVYVLSKIATY